MKRISFVLISILLALVCLAGCESEENYELFWTPGSNDSQDDDDDDDNDDNDDDTGDDTEEMYILAEFLPVAGLGEEYSFQLKTKNAAMPYREWEITLGQLPFGLTLNPETGIISGAAFDTEGHYFFVVSVVDRQLHEDTEVFGIRVGDESEKGPMHQRVLDFEDRYRLRHMNRGMSHSCDSCDDPAGQWDFADIGDSGMWSGTYCAGAAARYAVTQDADDLDKVRLCANGLDGLRRVTGQPGLLARGYMHKDDPYNPAEFSQFYPDAQNFYGEGDWADFYWRGDVSRDQYTGVMLGWYMMNVLSDDEQVQELAAENLEAIGDHIIANNLRIVQDGHRTSHGQLSGNWIDDVPFFNGFNAVLCLAWFQEIYQATGKEKFLDYYNLLIVRNYLWKIDLFCYAYFGYDTKWFNVNMAFDNFFILLRTLKTAGDPTYKEVVRLMEKHLWYPVGDALFQRRARLEGNPWFTYLYTLGTGKRDPEAIYYTLLNMADYPMDLEKEHVADNTNRPGVIANRWAENWSINPIPVKWRGPDAFIWQRSPYKIIGGGGHGEREWSGTGFIAPYWLGRYAEVINPNW